MIASMWAYRLTGPCRLEPIRVPRPSLLPSPGRVVLHTLAGGICGSDNPKFAGRRGVASGDSGEFGVGPAGFPLHEVVGEVVASAHPDLSLGETVVGWADHSDGLAEYVDTAGDRVLAYDLNLDPTTAVLIQSLGCVLEASERINLRNRSVAVLGVGPIGLQFGHAARAAGARYVVGIDPVARNAVRATFGFDATFAMTAQDWTRQLESGQRPDVTIEAVGHQVQTLHDAVAATADEGTVLYFGIPDQAVYPLPMERLLRKNLTLIAGVTRRHRAALTAASAYLRQFPELAKQLPTHCFGADSAQQAFQTAAQADQGRIKVVLDLTERQPQV